MSQIEVMRKTNLLNILIIVFFVVFISGCAGEMNPVINRLLGLRTTIYGELQVTQQWQEIDLLAQVKSGSPIHHIVLELKNGDDWKIPEGGVAIKNPQGEIVVVEAELIDEQGKHYKLDSYISRPGIIKLTLDYENGSDKVSVPKPVSGKSDGNVTFTKLRIKSNYPFDCSNIYWEKYGY